MASIKGMKVLVAGGAGFLGSHVCEALLDGGAEVRVLDVLPPERCFNLAGIKNNVEILTGSVVDREKVDKAVSGMDAVVDASFPSSGCNRNLEKQHVEVGTLGVFNLLRATQRQGARFVFSSSISVYGIQKYTPIDEKHPLRPFLLYGATKLSGEHYTRIMAEQYGCRAVALRFSDLYGPRNGRNSAPAMFLKQALRGESFYISGDGRQVRSYLYISDAARAVVCALSNLRPGAVYNITGDQPVSILELAETVREITGAQSPVVFKQGTERDTRRYIISGALAEKEIGYKPRVGLRDGLKLTLNWLKGESAS